MSTSKKPKTNGAAAPTNVKQAAVTLQINAAPIDIRPEQTLNLEPPADPRLPFLLTRIPDGSWRGIVLAPGMTWQLRAKVPAAKPKTQLWRPGMPS